MDSNTDEVQDDAIIGLVFRWSVVAMLVIAATVAAGLTMRRMWRPPTEAPKAKDTEQIHSLPQANQPLPSIPFLDVTRQAGIDFVHANGATGEKLLPETMGGGVAFLDYDNDGDQDLFFVNSRSWDENATGAQETQRLFANDGAGGYTDVTEAARLSVSLYGMGCAVGDYDDDGDVDLFLSAVGANQLYRNDDGQFVDVTRAAGVAGDDAWSTSCGFFDYDRDGDLDLFVCNYVQWSREIDFELNFTLNGTDRAYGPPTNYQGRQPYLYQNQGDGTFREVAEQAGLHVTNAATGLPVGKSLAVLLVDIDEDGYDDIVVANDTVQNFLFHNQQDGTFREIGAVSGIAFDRNGKATGAMGIDVAQPFGDGSRAIAIGNFANEMTSFYVSSADRVSFVDQALVEGIGSPSRGRLTFGVIFADFDLDGRPDFLQTNGHLEDEINEVQPSQSYLQPAQLFWNCGKAGSTCFAEIPSGQTADLTKPIVGRGAAYADIDDDGDLDLVLTQAGGGPMLLRNDQQLGHHWLRVKLADGLPSAKTLGAKISVRTGDQTQGQYLTTTRSYLSQMECVATFGVADATVVDEVTITWPDGTTETHADVAVDQTWHVSAPADEAP